MKTIIQDQQPNKVRFIQYDLTEFEFLRLKTYCTVHRVSLKYITRKAVLTFLDNNPILNLKGEVENG